MLRRWQSTRCHVVPRAVTWCHALHQQTRVSYLLKPLLSVLSLRGWEASETGELHEQLDKHIHARVEIPPILCLQCSASKERTKHARDSKSAISNIGDDEARDIEK